MKGTKSLDILISRFDPRWLSGRALVKDRSKCGGSNPSSVLGPARRVVNRHGNWTLVAMLARPSPLMSRFP